MLEQTRSVLKKVPLPGTPTFDPGAPDRDDNPFPIVSIGQDAWEELGRPNMITVTVIPGDQLNDD